MDYTIKTMPTFALIGFTREFSFDSSCRDIPRFWDKIMEKYAP